MTSRLLKNKTLIYAYLTTALGALHPLVIFPFIYSNYSLGESNLWLFSSTLIALGTLAEGGVATNTTRIISYLYAGAIKIPRNIDFVTSRPVNSNAERNSERIADAFKSLARLNYLSRVVSGVMIAVLAYPVGENLLKPIELTTTLISIAALIGITQFNISSAFYIGVLHGVDNLYNAKKIEFFCNFGRLLGIATIALLGVEFYYIFVLWFALAFLQSFVLRSKAAHLASADLGNKRKRYQTIALPQIWRTLTLNIGAFLITFGTTTVAAQLEDQAELNTFLFMQRLSVAILGASFFVAKIEINRFAELTIRGGKEEILNFAAKIVRHSVLAFTFIYSCFMAVFWGVGAENLSLPSAAVELVIAFFAVYLLELHHSVCTLLYLQKNHNPFLPWSIGAGIAIVSLSYFLGVQYGALGLVLSQGFVQILTNNWVAPSKLSTAMNLAPSLYLKKVFFPRFDWIRRS